MYYFSIGVFVFCVFTVYVTLDTSAGTLECHSGFWVAHGSDDVAGSHPAPTSPLRRQVVHYTNQVQPLHVPDDWRPETGHRVRGVRICVSHLLCRESATGLSRTARPKSVAVSISSFVFFWMNKVHLHVPLMSLFFCEQHLWSVSHSVWAGSYDCIEAILNGRKTVILMVPVNETLPFSDWKDNLRAWLAPVTENIETCEKLIN